MYIYTGVLSCLFCMCAAHPHNYSYWDHSDQGKSWPASYSTCGGKNQSPIDIKAPECVKALKNSIQFINYANPGSMKFALENNGRWLKVRAPGTHAQIIVDNLGTYDFHQLHLHWGSDDSKGSEHRLNGKAFPAAVHLYHIHVKYNHSFHDAQPHKDAFVILGFFVKIAEEDNPAFDFLNFTTHSAVINPETEVNITQFPLNKLLPKDLTTFYRYRGSIPNPPCDESVVWTIYDQPIYLSRNQLNELRRLKYKGGNTTMSNNYRALQELNGRKITYWDEEKCESGATAFGASIFSAIFSLLLFALL